MIFFALLFISVEMSNVYDDTMPYEILWSEQFGTSDLDVINTVTIDNAGNIIVAGNTKGSLDGDHAGNKDVFIRSYDTAGNMIWGEQLGTSDDDYINTVTIDNTGNIIVAGHTWGSLDGDNADRFDAFIRAYTFA